MGMLSYTMTTYWCPAGVKNSNYNFQALSYTMMFQFLLSVFTFSRISVHRRNSEKYWQKYILSFQMLSYLVGIK